MILLADGNGVKVFGASQASDGVETVIVHIEDTEVGEGRDIKVCEVVLRQLYAADRVHFGSSGEVQRV